MDVEQEVDGVVELAQLARTHELGRRSLALQRRRGPHAIEVLVDKARLERFVAIERAESGVVGEAERQTPRRGRTACSRRKSAAIAPHTSLPCVSAWIATCAPAKPLSNVHRYGTPRFPFVHRVMSGNAMSIVVSGDAEDAADAADMAIRSAKESESRSGADLIDDLAQEILAPRELLERHQFVRLVRLRDVAGTAED